MSQQLEFRAVLLRIQDRLSESDRQRLHFLLADDLPATLREDVSLSGSLRVIQSLLDKAIIDDQDCVYLIEAMKTIGCKDAAKWLEEYQRSTRMMEKTSSSLQAILYDDHEDDKFLSVGSTRVNKYSFVGTPPQLQSNPWGVKQEPVDSNASDKSAEKKPPPVQSSWIDQMFRKPLTMREILLLTMFILTLFALILVALVRRRSPLNGTKNCSDLRANCARLCCIGNSNMTDANSDGVKSFLDQHHYYRLTNDHNGPTFALDIGTDKHNFPVETSPTSDRPSQSWYLVPCGNQACCLRNRLLTNVYSLGLVHEEPRMIKTNNSKTQRWRFIPLDDGTFRIANEHLGDQRFFDVFSTGHQVQMGTNEADYSGQHWTFHRLEEM